MRDQARPLQVRVSVVAWRRSLQLNAWAGTCPPYRKRQQKKSRRLCSGRLILKQR
jgi:hypothetical protein